MKLIRYSKIDENTGKCSLKKLCFSALLVSFCFLCLESASANYITDQINSLRSQIRDKLKKTRTNKVVPKIRLNKTLPTQNTQTQADEQDQQIKQNSKLLKIRKPTTSKTPSQNRRLRKITVQPRTVKTDEATRRMNKLSLYSGTLPVVEGWKQYRDREHGYRIQAPADWNSTFQIEGAEHLRTILSSDQLIALRVVSSISDREKNPEDLRKSFEKDRFKGAKLIQVNSGNLANIPSSTAFYSNNYQGLPVNIVAVYLLKDGYSYVIWIMVPQELLQQRSSEAESVLSTFEFVQ